VTTYAALRRFRIIRGVSSNHKTSDYLTAANRDRAAQKWATRDREVVLCFLWDESHPQDELNAGWAFVGVVNPPLSPTKPVKVSPEDMRVVAEALNDAFIWRMGDADGLDDPELHADDAVYAERYARLARRLNITLTA
jgi:hypothetical protein